MSNRKPMVLVFAGPNGSGKSTISDHFEFVGEYTNADNVVASTGISDMEAAKQVDLRRYQAMENRRDFTFETVLSSDYKMDLLKTAKEKGYFVKCFFILTKDPLLNVARVRARAMAGGHDVDPDIVKRRYWGSLKNVSKLIDVCDILHIYDNTKDEPRRIFRKHKDDITLFPNDVWSLDDIMELVNGYKISD